MPARCMCVPVLTRLPAPRAEQELAEERSRVDATELKARLRREEEVARCA